VTAGRIFHCAPTSEWDRARAAGEPYTAPSLATEGFIHCSTEAQLDWVIDRHYRDLTEPRTLLEIDPARLTSELRWDHSPSAGEAFPHVYGPINVDAVVATSNLADRISAAG
jgi:uncharacterized protein (DUF952 family)